MEILLAVLAAGLLAILSGVRVYREYERAIVFRLGRARQKALGPGMKLLLPFGIDRAVVVDTRTKVIQIPPQEIITRDNISIGVDAVVYTDVASPTDAVLRVEEYMPATLQLAATTLRSVLGRMELDDILAKRAEINVEIRQILDERTEQWGVEITAVEIKDIALPQEMKRAMARQAEAERERRAKIIVSEGELQAAEKLAQAAALISSQPAALQLRTLQTLVEVSAERNNTIIFPIPIELLPTRGEGASPAVANLVTSAATALAARRSSQPAELPEERTAGRLGSGLGDRDVEELDRLRAELDPIPTRKK
ncbi:MAG TPA: slipin family protein [Kofleriaceae bacterium]|jgi:regulator of protease activity HflC (stomatin/prohibitin superfamily)